LLAIGLLGLWGGILVICFPMAYREEPESRWGQRKKGVPGRCSCFYEQINRLGN